MSCTVFLLKNTMKYCIADSHRYHQNSLSNIIKLHSRNCFHGKTVPVTLRHWFLFVVSHSNDHETERSQWHLTDVHVFRRSDSCSGEKVMWFSSIYFSNLFDNRKRKLCTPCVVLALVDETHLRLAVSPSKIVIFPFAASKRPLYELSVEIKSSNCGYSIRNEMIFFTAGAMHWYRKKRSRILKSGFVTVLDRIKIKSAWFLYLKNIYNHCCVRRRRAARKNIHRWAYRFAARHKTSNF